MQEIVPIVLTVMLSILTIMMVVVGVLAVQVLHRLKQTLDHVNSTIDLAEDKIVSLVSPMRSIGGMASSLKVGMHVFDSFLGWVNRTKRED